MDGTQPDPPPLSMFMVLIYLFMFGCLVTGLMVITLLSGERNLGVGCITGFGVGMMITSLLGALAPEATPPNDAVDQLSDAEKALHYYRRARRREQD